MRKIFNPVYRCEGIPYSASFANEVITKAICIFRMTRGNAWEAMKAAVNMGRDTDCLAAVSAGISGALTGAATVPASLVKQVDYATSINPHTCCKMALRETSDALFEAFKARVATMKSFITKMDLA
jgi:hypothetical protein